MRPAPNPLLVYDSCAHALEPKTWTATRIVGVVEPDWSALSHAYGTADDLPEILAELTPHESPVWGELWSRVCHQGTTYSASPYVLPILLQLAQAWAVVARPMPLTLAADIVASPEFTVGGFDEVVSELRQLARESAAAPGLSRSDRVYIMSSAVVFAGEADWGQELMHLHDEEFGGRCPSCERDLYLTIGDLGCFATAGDPTEHGVPRERILPCESAALEGFREWVYRIALVAGDEELAARICCVFGQSQCPSCQKRFQVAEAIERLWRS